MHMHAHTAPYSKNEEGNCMILSLVAYLVEQAVLCKEILYKVSCVLAYTEY